MRPIIMPPNAIMVVIGARSLGKAPETAPVEGPGPSDRPPRKAPGSSG